MFAGVAVGTYAIELSIDGSGIVIPASSDCKGRMYIANNDHLIEMVHHLCRCPCHGQRLSGLVTACPNCPDEDGVEYRHW